MVTFVSAPHPFPARMAPELALSAFNLDRAEAPVLDPMCGSGTVLRSAAQAGYDAVGFDVDPLAVLMASVWTSNLDAQELEQEARSVVRQALSRSSLSVHLPWIDSDPETAAFIDYWFAASQRHDLRLLASVLWKYEGPLREALQLCLSRIIITKDRGASLARDVSHSRPHRVALENDYDVMQGYIKSATQIAKRIREPIVGNVSVSRGDARNLLDVQDSSIGQIVTSPPYLNAIDYLRGHRLALVWLGYRFAELRDIRGTSIGAERGLRGALSDDVQDLLMGIDKELLVPRTLGMLSRYAHDLRQMLIEAFRVLRPEAHAVLVVGNSTIRGVYIENSDIATRAAESLGFALVERSERELPAARRYLPPPTSETRQGLSGRMRSEVILNFRKRA